MSDMSLREDSNKVRVLQASFQDVSLGLSTVLPPGPVLVTSVVVGSWAERHGLTMGAEIMSIGEGTDRVNACHMTKEVFLEAVRDRPVEIEVRIAGYGPAAEVAMHGQKHREMKHWPIARPRAVFVLGDDGGDSTAQPGHSPELHPTHAAGSTVMSWMHADNPAKQASDGYAMLGGRPTLDSPMRRLDDANQPINTLADALRAAHKHAVGEAQRYWQCEMAISRVKMAQHSTKAEVAEMRELLFSEPRLAEAELQAALDKHTEAEMIENRTEAQQRNMAELEVETAERSSTAHDVAYHFTRKQNDMNEAWDITQKHSMFAQYDQHRAAVGQHAAMLEAHSAKSSMEMLPHIQAEVELLRNMLSQEEMQCDKEVEHGLRLRKEIRDLQRQDPAGQGTRDERDRLLREMRELNRLRRTDGSPTEKSPQRGAARPQRASVAGDGRPQRARTPPPQQQQFAARRDSQIPDQPPPLLRGSPQSRVVAAAITTNG